MGWPPAVVIVVRHGARLDGADNQWHLTSPTPYDPPLTYGGWNQSKALGARIANILRTRETDDELLEDVGGNARKRRHRIIIHTSPFLRCVQTSTAISAGLAQNPGHTKSRPLSSHAQATERRISQLHSSPRVRPMVDTGSPRLAPIPEPASEVRGRSASTNIRKSTLRIDAFLGEWLSPDYFELITPPPSSVMMVAGAKADLLRREDYSYLTQPRKSSAQGFPGGWQSPTVAPKKAEDETPLTSLSSLAQVLPRKDRANSLSSVGSNGNKPSPHRTRSPNPYVPVIPPEYGVYQPPIPTHAISSSEPTPPGYVAHARDACVEVDYQWDSMREPQNWGTGGEYGEEWSAMHKRFRTGMQRMINWYKDNDDPGKLLAKSPRVHKNGDRQNEEEEEDTDLVLILVTHGAGCNALIGALTNQPVLMDVGMSSLTMAVRKPTPVNSPAATPFATPKSHSRAGSHNIAVADEYDVKLMANTDHLRPPSTTSTPGVSRNSSSAGMFREKDNSFRGASSGPDIQDSRRSRAFAGSGTFGSMHRAANSVGAEFKLHTPVSQGSIGLWSAPVSVAAQSTDEEKDDMVLNFSIQKQPATSAVAGEGKAIDTKQKNDDKNGEDDDVAPLGLWGGKLPDATVREAGQKRRWTINER